MGIVQTPTAVVAALCQEGYLRFDGTRGGITIVYPTHPTLIQTCVKPLVNLLNKSNANQNVIAGLGPIGSQLALEVASSMRLPGIAILSRQYYPPHVLVEEGENRRVRQPVIATLVDMVGSRDKFCFAAKILRQHGVEVQNYAAIVGNEQFWAPGGEAWVPVHTVTTPTRLRELLP